MDNFHEEIIIKEKRGLNTLLYFFSFLGMILFGVIALFGFVQILNFQFNIPIIIQTLIFGAAAYGCFILKNNQMIEYDYSFTNGELDFAKVIANSKRKHLLSLNAKEFEEIAPLSHDNYKKVSSNPGIEKRIDVCLNKENKKIYYGYFIKDGKKGLLLFEPSAEMIQLIKLYDPRKVTV